MPTPWESLAVHLPCVQSFVIKSHPSVRGDWDLQVYGLMTCSWAAGSGATAGTLLLRMAFRAQVQNEHALLEHILTPE